MPNYVDDETHVIVDPTMTGKNGSKKWSSSTSFEMAGPRETIYFDPSKVHAAIVTCGGLCPGINDVIRSVVMELWYWYGVRKITGIRYGYRGFLPEYGHDCLDLTPALVSDIHIHGGTFLGSSRGGGDTQGIVDAMERMNINMLFTIGGDGTQKGALAIHTELKKRGLKVAVVGIPKTIDNDISFVSKTFGLETAYSMAVQAMYAAHTEAFDAYNGIGLVKLMGRDSGFIAANAALASQHANFVLIPEVRFDLDGSNGFLEHLRKRLEQRHHAMVCVAEGAGRHLFDEDPSLMKRDASGNIKPPDIGRLSGRQDQSLHERHRNGVTRSSTSIPANRSGVLPLSPVTLFTALSWGKTPCMPPWREKRVIVIGLWNGYYTHVPIEAVTHERKKIDPDGMFWLHVVANTGQPLRMVNE